MRSIEMTMTMPLKDKDKDKDKGKDIDKDIDKDKDKPEKVGGEGDAPDEGHQGVWVEHQRAAVSSQSYLSLQ